MAAAGDHIPDCETARGCPVEELATDKAVNDACDQFLLAKQLYLLTQDPRVQQKTFEELGLYDDPATLFQLETVHAKWVQQQRALSAGGLE